MALARRSLASLKEETRHAGTSARRLRELAGLDIALARQIAGLAHTPASVLKALARHESPGVRVAVANHPSTPSATLAALGTENRAVLLKALARHPRTPAATLGEIARDRRLGVREELMERRATPAGPLFILADDDAINHHKLCMRQGKSIGRSRRVIERLLARDERTRRGVAAYVPLERELVERLFEDESSFVRAMLFANEGIDEHGRWAARLLEHPDERTRMHVARGSLDAVHFERFLEDRAPFVRAGLASQMQLPVPHLSKLSRDRNAVVRGAVARRFSDVPTAILERLAGDREAGVRAMVADSRHATPEMLECLAEDPEEVVRFLVTCHRSTPAKAIASLADDAGETVFTVRCFRGPDVALRIADLARPRRSGAPNRSAVLASGPNTDRLLRARFPKYYF